MFYKIIHKGQIYYTNSIAMVLETIDLDSKRAIYIFPISKKFLEWELQIKYDNPVECKKSL